MSGRMIVAAILVAACGLQVNAQSKQEAASPAMKRPGPGPERLRLSYLVGEFSTSTRIMTGRPGAKDLPGTGTSSIRWGLDSMFLFIDDESVNPMMGHYKGFGVLGVDPAGSQYTLSMYNNFGDRPEYRGAFSGDTLVMSGTVPYPGGAFDQKISWFSEGNTVHLKVFNNMGKGFVQVIDQIARPR